MTSSVVLVLLLLCVAVVADLPTGEEIAKMRVKQLKVLLRERGIVCKGCAEKSDFVSLVKESIHLPKVCLTAVITTTNHIN